MKAKRIEIETGYNYERWTKPELLEEVKRLWKENRRLKTVNRKSVDNIYKPSYGITIERSTIKAPFVDDDEKMNDFFLLSKEEFLNTYSYINEDSYEMTMDIVKKQFSKLTS